MPQKPLDARPMRMLGQQK